MGYVTPQVSTTGLTNGDTYAFSAQDQNEFVGPAEFDFLGSWEFNGTAFADGVGYLCDPFFSLGETSAANSGVTFTGTPVVDPSNPGRYNMTPFTTTLHDGTVTTFQTVLYQANAEQWLWIDVDNANGSEFLGSLQQLGPLSSVPPVKQSVRRQGSK
jgi:hypothetical protein